MNQAPTHLARIDVLRAVAILLVFFCHGLQNVNKEANFEVMGFAGVPLFFVISGFCIHLSYLKEVQKNPALTLSAFTRLFFWRRFWRIYPPYLLALLVFWFVQNRHERLPTWHFWTHLFLVNNFHPASFASIAPPFWSLAVEWQFYLIYPCFLFFIRRSGLRNTLIGVAVVSALMRGVAAYFQDWSQPLNPALWSSPLALFFDWTLGVGLAELWVRKKRVRWLEWLAVPALMLFLLADLSRLTRGFSFTLAAVSAAGFMSFYLSRPNLPGKIERILMPIGICSYSFYLWHHPLIGRILYWSHGRGAPNTPVSNALLLVAVALVVLLLFSALLYRWVEKPAIACGRTLWSRWFAPKKIVTTFVT